MWRLLDEVGRMQDHNAVEYVEMQSIHVVRGTCLRAC